MQSEAERNEREVSYVGLEGTTRLETPLLPDERLVVAAGTVVEATDDGVVVRTPDVESEVGGIDVETMRRMLAAIDGNATVTELRARLAPELDGEIVDALLQSLVGGVLRVRIDRGRRAQKSLIVIDDFLDDADARRAEALKAEYAPVDWFLFPGLFSKHTPDNVPAVMASLEQLLGTPLVWGEGPIHGHFRYSSTEHRRRAGANVHVDQFSWNAVICLTPTELCSGGIAFYRHRATGLFGRDLGSLRASGLDDESFVRRVEELVTTDGPDEAKWEEIGRVDLRMNRLIVLDSRCFHRTTSHFGTTVADGRITQGFSCFTADDPHRFEWWA
jgi:hypothetical protein